MPSPTDPPESRSHHADLSVRGVVPPGIAGRLVGIGADGFLHSVHVRSGRVSYASYRVHNHVPVDHVVPFAGSILTFGENSLAHELRPDSPTLRPVDLAGHRRTIAPCPEYDPTTGELHLLARHADGIQAHVVVPSGALTRRIRPVLDGPRPIRSLVLSRNHVVFVADGVVGVGARDGELRTTWIATGMAAPRPAVADDTRGAVIVVGLTPLLERWTVHLASRRVEREVLDHRPRATACRGADTAGGRSRQLWTTGEGTIAHHDLVAGRHTHHALGDRRPGDLVVVTSPGRCGVDDSWLVGFATSPSGSATDLVVISTTGRVEPVVATARLARLVPHGLRCTWIPSGPQ